MKPFTLLAALACACTAVQAQTPGPSVEPGLWEVHLSLKSQSGQAEAAVKKAQAYIASLPPEQRKNIEDMMAAQGIRLGDQTTSLKACISKEAAERGEIPQQAGDCTQQVLERGPQSMRVKFSCATTPPANGEAVVDFQSRTAYTSRAVVDTEAAGQPERINVDQTGRWIAADCGDIQPFGR